MNKQIDKKCKDCLHYKMCLERFRKLKKENHYILIDENEYFAHADDCEFHLKSNDVAKKIFAEIEKLFRQRFSDEVDGEYHINAQEFAELKKKYESEGEE